MAKKNPTPENLKQGQTIYWIHDLWPYTRVHECQIDSLFICSEKIRPPMGECSFQYPRSRIAAYMKSNKSKFFSTRGKATKWAKDHNMKLKEF